MRKQVVRLGLKKNAMRVYTDRSRFKTLVASRRFGKTFLCQFMTLEQVQVPETTTVYIAPTLQQGKEIFFKPILRLLPKNSILSVNQTDNKIELRNGSTIYLRSGENFETLRGHTIHFAIVDECKDIKNLKSDLINNILIPAGGSVRGGIRIFCVGTPEDRSSEFYDLTQDPNWKNFHFNAYDGGWIPEEEIEFAKRNLSEISFKREYLAQFITTSGSVYPSFSDDNVLPATDKRVQFDVSRPTMLAWDFNINPLCVVLLQQEKIGNETIDYVVHEFYMEHTKTFEGCQEIKEYLENQGFKDFNYSSSQGSLTIYGDYAGHQGRSSSSRTDWQIIEAEFKNYHKMKIDVIPTKTVKDRVESVNVRLKSYSGDIRLYINENCKHLINDLKKVSWKENSNYALDDSNKKLTHISDSLSYFCNFCYPTYRKKQTSNR